MKSVHITELLQLNLIEIASRISAGVGVERGADSVRASFSNLANYMIIFLKPILPWGLNFVILLRTEGRHEIIWFQT